MVRLPSLEGSVYSEGSSENEKLPDKKAASSMSLFRKIAKSFVSRRQSLSSLTLDEDLKASRMTYADGGTIDMF